MCMCVCVCVCVCSLTDNVSWNQLDMKSIGCRWLAKTYDAIIVGVNIFKIPV